MDNEVISVYLEWVELYSVANSVAQDKRVPVFLTSNYAVPRNLLSPQEPSEQPQDMLSGDHEATFQSQKGSDGGALPLSPSTIWQSTCQQTVVGSLPVHVEYEGQERDLSDCG